jgi:predicted nucleotidyltransferase
MAFRINTGLPQAGLSAGQMIGSAFGQLGGSIGGMLTRGGQAIKQGREAENIQQQFQQILAANQNDPNALRVKGQELMTSPDVNMQRIGKMLVDEAVRLTGVQETQAEKDLTALQQKGELALFNMARMMQASPEEDISRSNLKRQSYLEIAKSYKVSPERAMEILDESIEKEKKGSEAKGYKVEKEIKMDGKLQSVVEFFDAQGNFLNRRVIGEVVGEDADAPRGRDDWKNPEIAAYRETVSEQREAGAEAIKYSDLLNDTIEIAGEKGQVGGVLGMARDFVIADVAGLGDAITVHRSRLNEVRMKNAIALLPRGPASDRDVKLALDASVDPKNLSPEDRIAYIRGMKKIADAEKEYMDGKLRWIEQTGDALAFGYERKVSLDGYNKKVDALRQDNATEVGVLDSYLQQARELDRSGNTQAAKELIEFVKTQDRIGYLDLLENQEAEQKRYDSFVEKNNITFN